jgi:hypothetical protein
MGALRVWPLVLGLVGGCFTQSSSTNVPYDPYDPNGGGWGTGNGGSGGSTGFGCHADTDCNAGSATTNVCARDGECMTADAVRIVHVSWTVRGQVASASSCTAAPRLDITFADPSGYSFGFAPVPCAEGRFTVDKMPKTFTSVSLARQYEYDNGDVAVFDATGNAALDLPY